MTGKNRGAGSHFSLARLNNPWLEIGLVVLFFTALTIFMTWPLVTKMGTYLLGYIGDNIYFVWLMNWFKRAVFELHISPFFVPYLNYPQGWNLAYTEIAPIMVVMGLPFALIGGATFGYNAALMLTFILSGLGMYLWISRTTGNRTAGLITGVLFAFVPYHIVHALVGHFHIMGVQWFPFYFWGLYEIFIVKDRSWRYPLLAGIMFGFIALTSIYYTYMALLITAMLAFCYLVFIDRRQFLNKDFWINLARFIVISLPLLVLGVLPFLQLSNEGAMAAFPIEYSMRYSASVTDFFIPPTFHFLWGKWISDHFDRQQWIEATLYLGVVSSMLALLAFAVQRKIKERRMLWLSVVGGLFAFILALGVYLFWLNQPVSTSLPGILHKIFNADQEWIRLPGYFLYYYLPFYSKMRVWMRFGIFVLVFLTSMAGLGAAWLLGKLKRNWQIVLAAGLIFLALFEFYPGPFRTFSLVQGRAVDYWLKQQPGTGAVAQFPFELESVQDYIYYQGIYEKPYLGGFYNAFPPAQYTEIKPVMETFPSAESIQKLRELGVEYILVNSDYYDDMPRLIKEAEMNGLVLLKQFGKDYVLVFK